MVGVVGVLQLDVLKSRVAAEYGADIEMEAIPYQTARWVTGDPAGAGEHSARRISPAWRRTASGGLVFLARNPWELDNIAERYPTLRFADTREL